MLNSFCPIPNRINAFLEYNCYDKAKIAERLGISPDEFYDMLSLHKSMTADTFVRLCIILGKTAEYFVNYSIREALEATTSDGE